MKAVRLVSVTAVATATCALWALPAGAATQAVKRHLTTTIVSASPARAWVGTPVKLSAKVRSSGKVPVGTVTFRWAGRTLCVGHLSRGSASCHAIFHAPGSYLIRGFYSGDATHRASVGATREAVRRSPTTTVITNASPGNVEVGKTFVFHVVVTSLAGTAPASGTIVVAPVSPSPPGLPPADTCTHLVTGGTGTCTIRPPAYGIVYYKARYAGNSAHTGSTSAGTFKLEVQNVTKTSVTAPSKTAGSITLNAAVFAMGANITQAAGFTGTVTFDLSTTPTTPGAPGNPVTGCANLPLTSFDSMTGNNNVMCANNAQLNALAKGTIVYITAVFSGDPVNVPSTAFPLKLTVA
jgi:Bacterial Ig-like domain (group 3)